MKIEFSDLKNEISFDMKRDTKKSQAEVVAESTVDSFGEITEIAANRFMLGARQAIKAAGKRRGWKYEPVMQGITVGSFNYSGARQGWGQASIPIKFDHPALEYWARGTEDHIITPTDADALKIPWPDAPPGVTIHGVDDGTPFVFRQRAEVAGIDRIPFLEDGEKKAEAALRQIDVDI